jgi:hypothetical protein
MFAEKVVYLVVGLFVAAKDLQQPLVVVLMLLPVVGSKPPVACLDRTAAAQAPAASETYSGQPVVDIVGLSVEMQD